jgi:hypothetical protein
LRPRLRCRRLALTSKPELAVRDQLGWLLQRGVAPRGYSSREWHRSDLALLVDEKPRLLVEGKAMYGFDALNPRTRDKYVNLVAADQAKARRLDSDADVVATVLVSSPRTPWSPECSGAVAYASQNAAFAAAGEEAVGRAVESMREALRTLGAVATIDLGTGEAFDGRTTKLVVRPPHHPSTSRASAMTTDTGQLVRVGKVEIPPATAVGWVRAYTDATTQHGQPDSVGLSGRRPLPARRVSGSGAARSCHVRSAVPT